MSSQIISQFHAYQRSGTKGVDAFSCPQVADYITGADMLGNTKENKCY